jgi:transcription elongation factor SPT6
LTSTDEWLTTYTNANPKRSMYMFCFNREKPGSFHLCFKAGQKAKLQDWQVRVIP